MQHFNYFLPDQLHRKYCSCLDIQSQNGKLFFYFSWPVWLGQYQSHSGLFQLRRKKTGINQIMWKTQCLHHNLPSAKSKQPIPHQWVSKYTHSWTNTEENKGMQGISRHPGWLPRVPGCHTAERSSRDSAGTEGQQQRGTCCSLCLHHWFRAGVTNIRQKKNLFSLSLPLCVSMWFSS